MHMHAPFSLWYCNIDVMCCAHTIYCCTFVWVCEGGGSADPGSTVSQAASHQAGLSHGPPGESCLLCARAVMIVPAGGDCTCALIVSPTYRTAHFYISHSCRVRSHACTFMYNTAYSCRNTHICSRKNRSSMACMHLFTVRTHRVRSKHRCMQARTDTHI